MAKKHIPVKGSAALNNKLLSIKAEKFRRFYNEYYMSKHSDEDITDYTTQAYYNNMNVERKRLEEKGLMLETKFISNKEKRDEASSGTSQTITREGDTLIGLDENKCICERSFYLNGQKIYSDKSHEIVRTSLIAYDGDAKVECPNCGNTNKISSYINGCDYCGSKFEVKEFEPKVSAFTTNEDLEVTARKGSKFGYKLAIYTAYALFVLLIAGIIVSIAFSIMDIDSNIPRFLIFVGHYLKEPIIRAVILVMFAFFGISFLFGKYKRVAIKNAELIEAQIKGFPVQDFFQNIEMRLNLIYLAQDVNSVKAYSLSDLTSMVEKHLDIVDSHMSSLTFKSIRVLDDSYRISATAAMRLYSFANNRIKKSSEQVDFEVLVDKNTFSKGYMAIKAYNCCKCGNNIDVTRGGVCEYCGHELGLSDVKFRFNKLNSRKKSYSFAPKLIGAFIGAFVTIFGINMFIPNFTLGYETTLEALQFYGGITDLIMEICDTATLPEDCLEEGDYKVISVKNRVDERIIIYELKDKSVFDSYKAALKKRGMHIKDYNSTEFEAFGNKQYEGLGEICYLNISAYLENNRMELYLSAGERE